MRRESDKAWKARENAKARNAEPIAEINAALSAVYAKHEDTEIAAHLIRARQLLSGLDFGSCMAKLHPPAEASS